MLLRAISINCVIGTSVVPPRDERLTYQMAATTAITIIRYTRLLRIQRLVMFESLAGLAHWATLGDWCYLCDTDGVRLGSSSKTNLITATSLPSLLPFDDTANTQPKFR